MRIFILILIVSCSFLLVGQDDFQKYLRQEQSAFQSFREERDKEFMQFLQDDWKEFQAYDGVVQDSNPKPEDIPVAEAPTDVITEESTPQVKDIPTPPEPDLPAQEPPEPAPDSGTNISVPYFGETVRMRTDPGLSNITVSGSDEEAVAGFWKAIAGSDFDLLLTSFRTVRSKKQLNDWGYLLLIHRTGKQMYRSENLVKLFTWFYLLKSDYAVRIGFSGSDIFLLVPAAQEVFSTPFLTKDGRKYYILSLDGMDQNLRALRSYQKEYPGADAELNLRVQHVPVLAEKPQIKTFRFAYQGENFTVKTPVNSNIMDFYKTYPQTEIPLYFETMISPRAASSLVDNFRPLLDDRRETEAINILLRFVQTAFRYETDDQQFGRENYLFPEETLYYPASDCEDRAALFSYLVRNLLGLEVIGLDYPGHIATAVEFHGDVGRSQLRYNGKAYTICDPTYINAEYGMAMPSYKQVQPEIFTF